MAVIQSKLICEITPTVQDVCEVISAVAAYYPGQEDKYLEGVKKSIEARLDQLKTEKD